ncbi:hypothetical protein QBC38DRAFT_450055 [Podospora fimiseda]|uniref:Uncharacterized protein n=1 Tax=Podospora fimiseda TaxID=252190 RepID=A0AAN7C0Q8_9PEZI|nr:hypothetical protein QBC38DRAFT_450055 [Podospora fimiseda]
MAVMADTIRDYYNWFTELVFLRVLSVLFLTLALILIGPIILLIVYDISLWLWRLSGIGGLIDVIFRRAPPAQPRNQLNGNGSPPNGKTKKKKKT